MIAHVEPIKSAIASTSAGIPDARRPGRWDAPRAWLKRAGGKCGMDDAGALPDLHVLAAGLLPDVVAQVDVGQEQNGLLGRNRIDDFHRVAGGAQNIAFRFHLDRSIDIADDHVVRMRRR